MAGIQAKEVAALAQVTRTIYNGLVLDAEIIACHVKIVVNTLALPQKMLSLEIEGIMNPV